MIPPAWRESLALLAFLFWVALALGYLIVGLELASRALGVPWSFAPVAA